MFFFEEQEPTEPTEMKSMKLQCPLELFIFIVFDDREFYSRFLTDQILERDVCISPWTVQGLRYERTVRSIHPLPQVVSWIPLEVVNTSIQSLELQTHQGGVESVTFQEKCLITGLGLIEPTVVNEWRMQRTASGACEVICTLAFEYETANLLQGVIEMNTRLEMLKFYDLFEVSVNESIKRYRDTVLIACTHSASGVTASAASGSDTPALIHLTKLFNVPGVTVS